MEHKLEADFIIYGISIQEPYEGTLVSINKYEFEFKKRNLKNCVQILYRVGVESDIDSLDQGKINQILIDEITLFGYVLSLLLVRPSQLISYKTRLDGVAVERQLPPRNIPPGIYNFVALWDDGPKSELQRYSSMTHKDSWQQFEQLLSELRKGPTQVWKKLALALRWFAKGSNEMFSIDRLVAYWIAFNSLYSPYHQRGKSEQHAIGKYIDGNTDLALAGRFVKDHEPQLLRLSTFQVKLRNGRVISQDLADLLKSPARDNLAILKIMSLTIYGTRNNLFHGSYDLYSENAINSSAYAEQLLSNLLKELMVKKMLGYSLAPVKFIVQTQSGI